MNEKEMKILIACEFSGIVREAFKAKGHDAWSCDLRETERLGNHYQCDILEILDLGWDLAIMHPECTFVAGSGLHWNKKIPDREEKTKAAIEFCEKLWAANIPKIALENPVGCLSTRSDLGKASQFIQPYQFGEDASKKTCLWLKNLPLLKPTSYSQPRIVEEGKYKGCKRWSNQTDSGQNKLPPEKNKEARAKKRSVTYQGIAKAMSEQWG